ncbi:MAG: Ig-like domain-containing protein, partial [Pirellulaceae bacterium]|nr:Ig-like domain-containing protein [Pirellulaceae bacterium]
QFIGDGSVVALNNGDTVVGLRTNPTTGVQTPLISVAGGAWTVLPSPAGASSAFPTDVNDAGVIVGVATMSTGRRAIRWTPAGAGYAVELLPLLPGELASYATGINNLGQIAGARAGILGTPYGFGWLYTDAGGLVDLNARYGWFATPNDINDSGVILSGTQLFDLSTQTVTDVGLPAPAGYNAVGGVAINNAGQIVGSATLSSISLNIVSVFRYGSGTGWEFISGSSRWTVANDINNLGDVGWGEQGAGIYLEGLGKYALYSLLDSAAAAAGWTITGNGCLVNDHRVVATLGRNATTGQSGAVLLTPTGLLAPPAAPTGLTATPHPATASEPYMSINLAWNNGDLLRTQSYQLERRPAGQATWASVALVPPAMSTLHQDTTVAPATSYDYRVRAVGVAGPGPWSTTATATSPSTPLDATPPEVTILTPANGASVSGIVQVSAQASDDVGVEFLEISYWNQYLGQDVILGSVADAGSFTVNWDTRGLTPAPYTVWAFAYDAIGNWTQTEITVNVASAVTGARVSNIALSGKVQGSKANITGTVYVKDPSGVAVRSASVAARWTLPGGSTVTSASMTDSAGRAKFAVSGPRGTYTLTVTGVTKAGYVFDAAGSVLSKSITK